eukprot:scaffold15507_cov74-Cyclotella_meneghiniana.AAC.5
MKMTMSCRKDMSRHVARHVLHHQHWIRLSLALRPFQIPYHHASFNFKNDLGEKGTASVKSQDKIVLPIPAAPAVIKEPTQPILNRNCMNTKVVEEFSVSTQIINLEEVRLVDCYSSSVILAMLCTPLYHIEMTTGMAIKDPDGSLLDNEDVIIEEQDLDKPSKPRSNQGSRVAGLQPVS